jgi:cold shock protein
MIVNGSVKFFNEERGYGFMLPDQPLGDIFFHIAALRKMGIPHVLPGQRAVFEVSIAPGRGLRVDRFFLVHSGLPEQFALEKELMNSLLQARSDFSHHPNEGQHVLNNQPVQSDDLLVQSQVMNLLPSGTEASLVAA